MKHISKIKFCLPLFIILFGGKILAQDTIVKISGEQIPAKILEITPTTIKYKKTNFLDGPTYLENKTDIQQIKYSNGSKDNFNVTTIVAVPAKIADKIDTVRTITKKDTVKTMVKDAADDYYAKPETTNVNNKKNTEKPVIKNESDDYYGKPAGVSGQLSIVNKRFKRNDEFISEKEFYNTLKQTNNKEILALVEKAGKAKKWQYICFGCIWGGSSTILIHPVVFILVEPVPILLYFKYRATRKNCNKKAVELYNKK